MAVAVRVRALAGGHCVVFLCCVLGQFKYKYHEFVGGAVASWLLRLSPDRAVRVRALAGGHCVVFLGKTLYSHSASLHPGV